MTRAEWEQSVLTPARAKTPDRPSDLRGLSERTVDLVCTPDDVGGIEYDREIGDPGRFPFTRGAHAHGYQDRPWTMRQSAAFGTPIEANAHYRHLLASGATGLSVDFDGPTLTGCDPDHPRAAGTVGHRGISVASVHDMLDLFADIDLGAVSVAMAVDGPAPMVFAVFLAAAERRGVAWSALSGTLQHDILTASILPPRSTMRLMTDVIAFCTKHVPCWCPVSVSGAHIRDAGATAQQELSFTLCDAIALVGQAVDAGLDVDDVGSRLSVTLSAHGDFFEEMAKHRAARQVWARVMRERFGARTDAACALRLHAQTSRASLATQQPSSNVVRVTYQALAAVLGGADSLHTCAFDDALSTRTDSAATLALRTQQVLANECGLTAAVDPLGGSWWVERLTRDVVDRTLADIEEIDRLGGMVAAVEQGLPQRQVADAARRAQAGRVPLAASALDMGDGVTVSRPERVRAVPRQRDAGAVAAALDRLRQAASGRANTMERFIDCARTGATAGEMYDVLRSEWGEYRASDTP